MTGCLALAGTTHAGRALSLTAVGVMLQRLAAERCFCAWTGIWHLPARLPSRRLGCGRPHQTLGGEGPCMWMRTSNPLASSRMYGRGDPASIGYCTTLVLVIAECGQAGCVPGLLTGALTSPVSTERRVRLHSSAYTFRSHLCSSVSRRQKLLESTASLAVGMTDSSFPR